MHLFATHLSGRYPLKKSQHLQQAAVPLNPDNSGNSSPQSTDDGQPLSSESQPLLIDPPTRAWWLLVKMTTFVIVLIVLLCFPRHQAVLRYQVSVSRPRIMGTAPYLTGFINTPEAYAETARVIVLSVCAMHHTLQASKHESLKFNWTIEDVSTKQTWEFVTDQCALQWQAPEEKNYQMRVQSWRASAPTLVVGSGSGAFTVHDIWLAVIGDSFAAGQGNPDNRLQMFGIVQAEWIDAACARSSRSFAYRIYEQVQREHPNSGVLFTYLPCSGATIRHGLIGAKTAKSYGGAQDPHQSQVAKLADIAKVAARGSQNASRAAPDVLIMTIGGNDIGYSDVLMALVWNEMKHLLKVMPRRLLALEKQLAKLAVRLRQSLPALIDSNVLLVEYYDFARNGNGQIDGSCADLQMIAQSNLELTDQRVTMTLNQALRRQARAQNWTYVSGVYNAFAQHGICAGSQQSYVLSPTASLMRQGNVFGAFHPNEKGHAAVADIVLPYVQRTLDNADAVAISADNFVD